MQRLHDMRHLNGLQSSECDSYRMRPLTMLDLKLFGVLAPCQCILVEFVLYLLGCVRHKYGAVGVTSIHLAAFSLQTPAH